MYIKSRKEENQEALKAVYDLMYNPEIEDMPEDIKTFKIMQLLLVDMSQNLAIIADKLEGEK